MEFKNIIRCEGSCGRDGCNHYLYNTDKGNRYHVTVRTYWQDGIENLEEYHTYRSEAGGRLLLGCSSSSSHDVHWIHYQREVTGEVIVNPRS